MVGTYRFLLNSQEIEAHSDGCNLGCLFNVKGQEYLADITINNYSPELVIFKTKNGRFSFEDALGVCYGLNVGFDFDSLRECVEDFVNNN